MFDGNYGHPHNNSSEQTTHGIHFWDLPGTFACGPLLKLGVML